MSSYDAKMKREAEVLNIGYQLAIGTMTDFTDSEKRQTAIFAASLYLRLFRENKTATDFECWIANNWPRSRSHYQAVPGQSYDDALNYTFTTLLSDLPGSWRLYNVLGGFLADDKSYKLSAFGLKNLQMLAVCGFMDALQVAKQYYQDKSQPQGFFSSDNSETLRLFQKIYIANS